MYIISLLYNLCLPTDNLNFLQTQNLTKYWKVYNKTKSTEECKHKNNISPNLLKY